MKLPLSYNKNSFFGGIINHRNRLIKLNLDYKYPDQILFMKESNIFKRNNIKMKYLRDSSLDALKQYKIRDRARSPLPKLLYSNTLLERKERDKKKSIEDALSLRKQRNKNNRHNNKPPKMFGELFDIVDDLKVEAFENKEEEKILKDIEDTNNADTELLKNMNSLNYLTEKNSLNESLTKVENTELVSMNSPRNTNLNTNNTSNIISPNEAIKSQKKISPSQSSNICYRNSPFLPKINYLATNDKKNTDLNFDKCFITRVTNISEDSLANKIRAGSSNANDSKKYLIYNNYGKYKYTQKALEKDKYKNDDESDYIDYRNKLEHPNLIYSNIGSFGKKFNTELARICYTYGKEESKKRFIRNPVMENFEDVNNFDTYKKFKIIENYYLNKEKYRFKLKPIKPANKLAAFDKLGSKIFEQEKKRKFKRILKDENISLIKEDTTNSFDKLREKENENESFKIDKI